MRHQAHNKAQRQHAEQAPSSQVRVQYDGYGAHTHALPHASTHTHTGPHTGPHTWSSRKKCLRQCSQDSRRPWGPHMCASSAPAAADSAACMPARKGGLPRSAAAASYRSWARVESGQGGTGWPQARMTLRYLPGFGGGGGGGADERGRWRRQGRRAEGGVVSWQGAEARVALFSTVAG